MYWKDPPRWNRDTEDVTIRTGGSNIMFHKRDNKHSINGEGLKNEPLFPGYISGTYISFVKETRKQ